MPKEGSKKTTKSNAAITPRVKPAKRTSDLHRIEDGIGKTISKIEYLDDEDQGQVLEIGFTDETRLVFELKSRVQIQLEVLKDIDGEDQVIRNYGVLAK